MARAQRVPRRNRESPLHAHIRSAVRELDVRGVLNDQIDIGGAGKIRYRQYLFWGLGSLSEDIRNFEQWFGIQTVGEVTGTIWKTPFFWPCDLLPAIRDFFRDPEHCSPEPLVEFFRRLGVIEGLRRKQRINAADKPDTYLALAAAMSRPLVSVRRMGEKDVFLTPLGRRSRYADHAPSLSNLELAVGRGILRSAWGAWFYISRGLEQFRIAASCRYCRELFLPVRWGHDFYCPSKACARAAKKRRHAARAHGKENVPQAALLSIMADQEELADPDIAALVLRDAPRVRDAADLFPKEPKLNPAP